jgi:beta-galactosidase
MSQLVRGVYRDGGVPVEIFAGGFMVDWRDGFWVATNFTAKVQSAPVPPSSTILLGERDVPIAGVTVWQN